MLPRDVSDTLTEFEKHFQRYWYALEEPLYSYGTTGDPDNPAVARAIERGSRQAPD